MINDKLKKYLVETQKEFDEKVKNKENVMILAGGEEKGMSSQGINISQVFDEELAKLTDKNITDICGKQKTFDNSKSVLEYLKNNAKKGETIILDERATAIHPRRRNSFKK